MKQDSSWSSEGQNPVEIGTTLKLSETATTENSQWEPVPVNLPQRMVMPRGRAILLAVFLLIVVLNATSKGSAQFIGAEGWAFVLGGPASKGNPNLLKNVANQLHTKLAPGATARAMPHFTPQEYLEALVQNMTLHQQLGQLMIVQFVGPQYGPDISTMLSQYILRSALLSAVHNTIPTRPHLTRLSP